MTNVINMNLRHSEFGSGQLKAFLGDFIVVRFSHGDEQLPFPQAFENDLKTVQEDDRKKIEEMIARWKDLQESKTTVTATKSAPAQQTTGAAKKENAFVAFFKNLWEKIAFWKKKDTKKEEVKEEVKEKTTETEPQEENKE